MTTDEMKPEMKHILTTLFDMENGELEVAQIAKQLNIQFEEARYYVDKLYDPGLIHFSEYDKKCSLSVRGRAYVMEKLRK